MSWSWGEEALFRLPVAEKLCLLRMGLPAEVTSCDYFLVKTWSVDLGEDPRLLLPRAMAAVNDVCKLLEWPCFAGSWPVGGLWLFMIGVCTCEWFADFWWWLFSVELGLLLWLLSCA